MGEIRLIEAVRESLREEMQANADVFLIGQDIGLNGGVFRVTDGLFDEFGPSRVIDSPLAESGMVGVAIGAAMNGMRPVVEIQFADFIFPAFNQIVSEAARMYYRTNGEYTVPIVIRAPYGGGVRGGLYHSQSVEAYFAHVPGLKVVIPSSPYDAKGLLKAAIRDDNPVLFFEHKLSYNTVRGQVPDEDYTVPIGQAAVRREGQHLSLISYGLSMHHCLEAAETLSAEGISCEVVDLRTVSPLDTKTFLESCERPAGRASSTRTTSPAAWGPRWRPSSPRTPLITWMPRYTASPRPTFRHSPTAPPWKTLCYPAQKTSSAQPGN